MTKKIKKTLLITISCAIAIVVVVIMFISPISKFLIEKFDEKFLGRQITMSWIYVNPFTGYIHIKNLKIYELNSDSLFFSSKGLSANLAMLKLLNKTYEIDALVLDSPRGIIVQNKNKINFADLIERFTSKQKVPIKKTPVHFNILNITIKDGEFHFNETQIPINYFIKNVTIESKGKWWNNDTMAAQFSFSSGAGTGDVKGSFSLNFDNLEYQLAVVVNKFDLNIIQQYLRDITNYGSFRASVNANISASGNFKDKENLTAVGQLEFNDFHFGKNPKEDFASFDKLVLAITELSPKNHKYLFDSIAVFSPYFKYERYDKLDNVQTMFGKKGSKVIAASAEQAKFNLVIEIARYIKLLAKNFFRSNYNINRLAIYKGDLRFTDYSLSEKFSIGLKPLNAYADSIDKNHKRVGVSLVSQIQPYGNAIIKLSINPKDSSDFDLNYHFQKLPTALFNPYLISYTSFPLDRGTLDLKGTWNVSNGAISSDNHITVIDPRVTKRLKNKDNNWLPLRFIMALIRERGNVIDYEVPITGNLNDPKFHLRDVIFDVVTNIFVKPATTPYRIQVRNIEAEIEKSLAFHWEMNSAYLIQNQSNFIEKIAKFLSNNPGASITVSPQIYAAKEKEYILFFEAKKKYYLASNKKTLSTFDEQDSLKINKMSIKDSLFMKFIDYQTRDSMLFTIQEKCAKVIDAAVVNAKFNILNSKRKNLVLDIFKEMKVEKQVKFSANNSVIPFNGFSFYKIDYKGEFPEDLIEAYREINSLNNKAPRKKFKQQRIKTSAPL